MLQMIQWVIIWSFVMTKSQRYSLYKTVIKWSYFRLQRLLAYPPSPDLTSELRWTVHINMDRSSTFFFVCFFYLRMWNLLSRSWIVHTRLPRKYGCAICSKLEARKPSKVSAGGWTEMGNSANGYSITKTSVDKVQCTLLYSSHARNHMDEKSLHWAPKYSVRIKSIASAD